MATLYISSIGQKSADYGNDFEFSTTKDDGNKKFIKYTAVSLGYSQWNTDVDELTKFTTQKNQAFHFVWEGYNTFSKKLAGSTQAKISYLKNKDFMIGVDYGIYLIIFKGLYLKASIGYGSLFNKATDGSPYIFTYGGEGGYLFKIKSGEGKGHFTLHFLEVTRAIVAMSMIVILITPTLFLVVVQGRIEVYVGTQTCYIIKLITSK
jgi:hypothetical protein